MNIAGGQSERMNSVVGSDDDCGGKEPMTRRVDLIVVSILLLGCSMLLLPSPVAGQAGEANIVGVVSDSSGAVIVGATVTVVSTATGLTRTTKTGTDGAYTIANTPPGPYKVTVSQAGFADQESQIVLLTGTSPNLNFMLSPAGSKQNVTVQGLSPEIETNTATLHTTVTPQQVDDLPINGRDFSTLAALVPGATTGNQAVGKNYDPTKSNVPAISINGQSGRNLYMTIDGGDNTDIFMGGQNITLSLEAVQEFEVITHDPKAEYSRGIGGVVNVVTKSGTNNFHGSAFGFFRTDTLQSIDPISESLHKPKPPFGSQQMGGTIGGPLVKDRAFFFYSYERDQNNTSRVFNSGGAFPSLDGTVTQQPFRQNLNLARLDFRLTDKHTAFLRYAQEGNTRNNEFFSDLDSPTSAANEINKFQDVTAGFTSVLSSNKVNAIRAHYQYWNDDIKNGVSSLNEPTVILPSANFGASQAGTQNPVEITDQISDDFSLIHGRHTIRFGANFVYQPHEGIQGDFRHNRYQFTTNDYDPTTNTILAGNSLHSFRSWSSPDFNIVNRRLLHSGFYAQDDIRLHRLTIAAGLRYDYVHNLFYDRGTVAENLVAQFHNVVPGGPRRAKAHDTPDEFGPRLALAYDLRGDGRTVIRAGYARIYDESAIPSGSLFADLEVPQADGAPPFNFVFVPGGFAGALGIPCSATPCQPTAIGTSSFPFSFPIGFVTSPDMRVAKSEQGNIGISHQLGGDGPLAGLVLEAQGVYNYTSRLAQGRNLNYCVNKGDAAAYQACLNSSFNPNAPNGVNFPQAGQNDPITGFPREIFLFDSTGRADYRAFILSARRNFAKRWQLLASYTLSRAQTDTNQFQFVVVDQANPHAPGEFGPSNWDETHRAVISGSVDLGKGFLFSTIFSGASARPYTAALFGGDVNGDGVPTTFGDINNGPGGSRTENVASGDRVGQRGAHRGNPTISWDMRILKGIGLRKLSETARLEGLFEVFNLTNHTNYGQNYFDAIDQPNFGKPINIITPPRTAQLGARFVF
jgi:hypothetical protein